MKTPLTVVVSGLPRSGTSLMMQMLEAGGVPPLTDAQREPDESNPRGYYELEAVKSLAKDASCLADAPGHAVKVIHRLLPHLPPEQTYAVIVMRRDTREVIASQRAMLDRMGTPGAALDADRLASMFANELNRAVTRISAIENARVLEVDHARAITTPADVATSVTEFLRSAPTPWIGPLDPVRMAATVDPSLHRERGPTGV